MTSRVETSKDRRYIRFYMSKTEIADLKLILENSFDHFSDQGDELFGSKSGKRDVLRATLNLMDRINFLCNREGLR